MRLWHYKIIPYLPDSQLKAQWRELNSIYKDQPKHILINYVYEYDRLELYIYSTIVEHEMINRGIHFKYSEYYYDFFKEILNNQGILSHGLYRRMAETMYPFENHHNNRYLLQCFYNLQEKYDRGQKDFSKERFDKLVDYVKWIDD